LCAPLRLFSLGGRFLVGGCRESPPAEVIFRAMIRIGDPIPDPAPLDVVMEGCGTMTIAVIARAVMRSGAPAAMWHSTWRVVVVPRCIVL